MLYTAGLSLQGFLFLLDSFLFNAFLNTYVTSMKGRLPKVQEVIGKYRMPKGTNYWRNRLYLPKKKI
jgi:hypothetical protein